MDGFDVCPTLPIALGDDIDALADMFRPYTALYVGGMGSRKQNFYNRWPGAWATSARLRRSRTSTWTATRTGPRPPYRTS